MSEANSDKSAKSETKSATPVSPPPGSSPDELVKDLDVKLSEEEQSKVIGGGGKFMPGGF